MQLIEGLDSVDIKMLQREIMRFRGELLFSNALILVEGVTEDQIIPSMFSAYFGKSAFSLGVNCIGVSGKNYSPFIKMALSFGIPVCIVSGNDGMTKTEVESQIKKIKNNTSLILSDDNFHVSFLLESNDIEAELMHVGLREEIIEALVKTKTKGSDNSQCVNARTQKIVILNDDELLEKMRASKASYAGFLAEIISKKSNNRSIEQIVPEAVIDAFKKLKKWV